MNFKPCVCSDAHRKRLIIMERIIKAARACLRSDEFSANDDAAEALIDAFEELDREEYRLRAS
jgi:hypothetical protein